MDRLFLLSLLAFALFSSAIAFPDEDPLIRQVVSETETDDSHLLNAEHHFSLFKSKFGKIYASEEEHDHRFKVFKANLRRARRHQLLDPSAEHGITKFSDLTPSEFRRTYLGLHKPKPKFNAEKAPILPTSDLPADYDWRDHGAVTGVKNQGSCGSCWSFSTTGAVEGAHFLATGELVSLSEQQLVDCDHECDSEQQDSCDAGCGGGLMTTAFEYTLKAGGLQLEKDYPYTGKDGKCHFDKSKIAAAVTNFSVIGLDEDQIAANLVKHGPLAVGINAAWMQTYVGGVSCPLICFKRQDHGVLLVGYGSHGFAPIRLKEKAYWIIKNSWGENWGEHGYYKICRKFWMEKPAKSKKNMILKLLPKAAAAAVIFQNHPFSPGREKRLSHLHNHKGFSGPILIPVEARSRKSNNEITQEPTSPKVSCIGQIKQRKKKMVKTTKPVEKNSVSSLAESNKKKSRSSFRNIFQRGGRKSDACNSADNNISSDIPNRVPCNLSQMKKFASGRESSLSNFDWKNVQITPEDHRKCYSDDDRSDYCDEDEDEEEEVIIPFSAPILIGSRDRPNFPLEPKKEINLWKRRTMTKPNPLQLMKK